MLMLAAVSAFKRYRRGTVDCALSKASGHMEPGSDQGILVTCGAVICLTLFECAFG
jgi:hypothetical protein